MNVPIGGFLLVVSSVLYGAVQSPAPAPAPVEAPSVQAPAADAAPSPSPAAPFDVSACAACHEKAVQHMATTPLAGVPQACAACHGDVTAHVKASMEGGAPGPLLSIKKMKPADVPAPAQNSIARTPAPNSSTRSSIGNRSSTTP